MDDAVEGWLRDLQRRIVAGLEQLDGGAFVRDEWRRTRDTDAAGGSGNGGGAALSGDGLSCVLEGSALFERAGVLFSAVEGPALPAPATQARPEVAGKPFIATGVSLVLHPRSPRIPTTHMNVRSLRLVDGSAAWFGGGFDLTPYYPVDGDILAWHRACERACAPFGKRAYAELKARCDDYFFLRHRGETRGVGGLFIDDLDERTRLGDGALGSRARAFALIEAIGEAFLPAYARIVLAHKDEPWGARERNWQLYRRGRYVEFNLVYDRGTHFGLLSGGRTESILASMPPLVSWRYDYRPEPGTPEAQLAAYLKPRDWLTELAD